MEPNTTTNDITTYKARWSEHINELARIKQTLDPQSDAWDELDEIRNDLHEIVDEAAASMGDYEPSITAGQLMELQRGDIEDVEDGVCTVEWYDDDGIYMVSGDSQWLADVDPDDYDLDAGKVLARIHHLIILEMEAL